MLVVEVVQGSEEILTTVADVVYFYIIDVREAAGGDLGGGDRVKLRLHLVVYE